MVKNLICCVCQISVFAQNNYLFPCHLWLIYKNVLGITKQKFGDLEKHRMDWWIEIQYAQFE